MHHEPQYYPSRNHLVDFLLNRRTGPRLTVPWLSREPAPGVKILSKAEVKAVPARPIEPPNFKETA